MASKMPIKRIGIIGGGVVGLSVSNILQDRYPNSQLELTSHKPFELTTSWGAPGIVRFNANENKHENTFKWYKKGIEHYSKLYRMDCVNAGISMSYLYYVSDKPIEIPTYLNDLYQGVRSVDSKELAVIGFAPNMRYGIAFITPLVESRYYLPYLADNFTKKGGKIINGTIPSGPQNVADWAIKNQYDLVVNCSGLGARTLFDDKEVIPLRGQLVRVDAPWFKHSFLTSDDSYAYSCRESVVLGGFRQKDDYDLSIRQEETEEILRKIRLQNSNLADSKIIEIWTGLRPFRSKLRLEIEYITASCGSSIPVIHNYGHGSSGIGLSWGSSLEAADLVEHIVNKIMSRL